jgi:hypothetical protein
MYLLSYLKPVNGRHDENVRAEIGPDHLAKLNNLADCVAAVKVWPGRRPHDLGEEGEKGREEVGEGQVQDEVVHPAHLME